MKLTDKKVKYFILDGAIFVAFIVLFILIDFFVISFRSAPAEQTEVVMSQDPAIVDSDVQLIDKAKSVLAPLESGEKIFLPILNFHHIDSAPAGVSKTTASYYIEPAEFTEILDNLIEAGYQTYFMSELVEMLESGMQPPDNALALTFDDGNINFYTKAWPILREKNLKSSIYIMSGVGGENYMNDAQIIEVVKDGYVELGSHTIWHPKLTKIDPDERLKELEISKEDLEDLIPWQVEIISYPFGLYDQDVKDLAQAVGYKAGLTYDQEVWQDPFDLMELKRVSVFPGMNVVKFLDKLKNN